MLPLQLLLGVNGFWLALRMLGDGLNTLLLPALLLGTVEELIQVTRLGTLTSVGLPFGVLVQPMAGLIRKQQRAWVGHRPPMALDRRAHRRDPGPPLAASGMGLDQMEPSLIRRR